MTLKYRVILRTLSIVALVAGIIVLAPEAGDAKETSKTDELSIVVMDPLSAPLSCPCVEGYAQRKYEALAKFLEKKTGRKVRLSFAGALNTALKGDAKGKADLIIGKDSVIRADAKKLSIGVTALGCLTDKDGKTTQTGLIVVPSSDPAKKLADLNDYRILFGPADCQEKHQAAINSLKSVGVAIPKKLEVDEACSDGACRILEFGTKVRAAAVISSYAAPLLEGCGTIKKGDLRVVGETKPVPFITAFATDSLTAKEQKVIQEGLMQVIAHPKLCTAIETLLGFIPPEEAGVVVKKKVDESNARSIEWTGWRGTKRDGRVDRLPATLPKHRRLVWESPLGGPGLGGIAATKQYVLIGDRDLLNSKDVFRCFTTDIGLPLWEIEQPTEGKFDYGETPRTTPLIHGDLVYLLGAFGHLHCVRLATGEVVWKKNLRAEFGVKAELPWGYCGSPLLVGKRLIVSPGGADASIVAFNASDGKLLWKTTGNPPSYGSMITGTFGGVQQIVGHDATTLGGWDVETGKRLWTIKPKAAGDFNVPTPIQVGERLLVTTENNGTRLYRFKTGGEIEKEPVMFNSKLHPDMTTPVVIGDRVFCISSRVHCLDMKDGLKHRWMGRDAALGDYSSLIADNRRILVTGVDQLLLLDATADSLTIVSRLKLFEDGTRLYSHPALVGTKLYVRGETSLVCIDLAP